MSLADVAFDRAFAEWQEFGPRRAIPIEQRWSALFPDSLSRHFPDARRRCEEIENFAYNLADQVPESRLTDHEAFRALSEEYPNLTEERLRRTWSQAMYFASK